ncbi:MAG: glyoxylase-like metal-dependent hydrolase (beta-lactamase superfamily II) [Granulosicoccus sp.]|jgi:glyoxylase-like metal-dependent hydrolase (beta-lactamase superfamily II)/rhodanese-related sulfurtransferase
MHLFGRRVALIYQKINSKELPIGQALFKKCIALLLVTIVLMHMQTLHAQSTAFVDVSGPKLKINNLDTQSFLNLIEQHPDLVVMDVRLPEELVTLGGSIDSSRRDVVLSRGWLEFRADEVLHDFDTPVVVYCGTNRRSPLAAETLQQMGYTQVWNYADGFFAWRDAGLPVRMTDHAVGTMLYRNPIEVMPGIYTAIGATAPATYENSGHNNNLSFIITTEGVVVVNASDNALLAESLHREVRKLTDQPVRYVVLENGQGHAMLGTDYWQKQGAIVIAHEDTVSEIEGRGESILERMQIRNRDKAMGTQVALPDETFRDERILELGGRRIEILRLGTAHSPGDVVVWLPNEELVIAGDMAFHQRLLPVFEDTDTGGWVETWPKLEALGAKVVVPGHGAPTTIGEVRRWTFDYLVYMRAAVRRILDDGGSLIDAYKIDQRAYRHLDTFDELAGLNADRIYRAMEFE